MSVAAGDDEQFGYTLPLSGCIHIERRRALELIDCHLLRGSIRFIGVADIKAFRIENGDAEFGVVEDI